MDQERRQNDQQHPYNNVNVNITQLLELSEEHEPKKPIKRRLRHRKKIRKDAKKTLRSSRLDIMNWKNISMRRIRRNIVCICGEIHSKKQSCQKKQWTKYFMKWEKGQSGKRFKKICRYCGQIGDLTLKKHEKCALLFKKIPMNILITKDRKLINSNVERINGKIQSYVQGQLDELGVQRLIKSVLMFLLQNAKGQRFLTQRGPIYEQCLISQTYQEAMEGGHVQAMYKGQKMMFQKQTVINLEDTMGLLEHFIKGKQPQWQKRCLKKAFIAFMKVIGKKNMTMDDMKTFKTDRAGLWPFVRDRFDNVRYKQVLSAFGNVSPAIYFIPAHIMKQIQEDQESFQLEACQLINEIGVRKVTEFELKKIQQKYKINDYVVEVLCRKQFQMVHFDDQMLDKIQQFEIYCCDIRKFMRRTKFQPFYKIECTNVEVIKKALDLVHEWIFNTQQIDQACDDLRQISYKILEQDLLGKLSFIKIQKTEIRQTQKQVMRQGIPLPFQDLVQLYRMHENFKNQKNTRIPQVVFNNKLEPGHRWLTLKYPRLVSYTQSGQQIQQEVFLFVKNTQDQKLASLKLIAGMLQTIYEEVRQKWFQFGKRRFLPRIHAPTVVNIERSNWSDSKLLKLVGQRRLWIPKDVNELKNSSFIKDMLGIQVVIKKPRGFGINKTELNKLVRFCSNYSISTKTVKIKLGSMKKLSKYNVYDIRRYEQKPQILFRAQNVYVRPQAICDEIEMLKHWLFKLRELGEQLFLNRQQLSQDEWRWLFNGLLYISRGNKKKIWMKQVFEKMAKVLEFQFDEVQEQMLKLISTHMDCYKITIYSGGATIQLLQILDSVKKNSNIQKKLRIEPEVANYSVQRGKCNRCRLNNQGQDESQQLVIVDANGDPLQEERNCCKPLRKRIHVSQVIQDYPVFKHIITKVTDLGTKLTFQKTANNVSTFFLNMKGNYKLSDFNQYCGRASKKIIQAKLSGITKKDAANIRQSVERSFYLPIQIAPSTIQGAGMGVFATRDLQAGTLLGVYSGQIFILDQAPQDDLQSQVQMGYVDNQMLIMVPTKKFNHGRFLNGQMAGFEANVLATRVITDIGRGNQILLVLMAKQAIREKTQLRWDYSGTFRKY